MRITLLIQLAIALLLAVGLAGQGYFIYHGLAKTGKQAIPAPPGVRIPEPAVQGAESRDPPAQQAATPTEGCDDWSCAGAEQGEADTIVKDDRQLPAKNPVDNAAAREQEGQDAGNKARPPRQPKPERPNGDKGKRPKDQHKPAQKPPAEPEAPASGPATGGDSGAAAGGGEGGGGGGSRHSAHDYFCENRNKGAAGGESPPDGSSMTAYISTGGRFPVLLVTSERAQMLEATLKSLLTVRCLQLSDIFVIQDGGNAAVTEVLRKMGVAFHQKLEGVQLRGGAPPDGAERIAGHYGYSLRHMFNTAFPHAPAVIVAEDDFAFSPDFYEYFHAVAPALEADPSLWLASAWNDNGFDYLVADPYALRRTRFFPGLGWLLPRRVWEQELAALWPASHWDHWMRDPAQHRNRDVVYPEVPRDYHMGIKGTFMDHGTHNRYFGSIAMQADAAFTWDTPLGAASVEDLLLTRYEARLRNLLTAPSTKHLTSTEEIAAFRDGVGVVWYDCPGNQHNHDSMRAVAGYFGVWHEGARGSRDGIHELWWLGTSRLILVNVHAGPNAGQQVGGSIIPSSLRFLMPKGVTPLSWQSFFNAPRPQLPTHSRLFGATILSPLAHLDGGQDANGAPDQHASTSAAGGGGQVVVWSRGASAAGPEHAADAGEQHVHAGFMGDLKLKDLAATNAMTSTGGDADGAGGAGGAGGMSVALALPAGVQVVAAGSPGLSCAEVCAGYKPLGDGDSSTGTWTCGLPYLPVLNDCSTLKANFACSECKDSTGGDQPAMIARSAPADKEPGACLVNGDPSMFSCEGKWIHAMRLCPCMKPSE